MSIITTFLVKHLLPALEEEFITHEPEIQADFLAEVKELSATLGTWVENKMHKINPPK